MFELLMKINSGEFIVFLNSQKLIPSKGFGYDITKI